MRVSGFCYPMMDKSIPTMRKEKLVSKVILGCCVDVAWNVGIWITVVQPPLPEVHILPRVIII